MRSTAALQPLAGSKRRVYTCWSNPVASGCIQAATARPSRDAAISGWADEEEDVSRRVGASQPVAAAYRAAQTPAAPTSCSLHTANAPPSPSAATRRLPGLRPYTEASTSAAVDQAPLGA